MGAGADGAGRSGVTAPNECHFYCCSYNAAAKLAHTPAGEPSGVGVYTVALDTDSGRLRAVGATEAGPNPAFVVRHPTLPVCYVSTERIDADGEVMAYAVEPQGLRLLSKRSAVRARRAGHLGGLAVSPVRASLTPRDAVRQVHVLPAGAPVAALPAGRQLLVRPAAAHCAGARERAAPPRASRARLLR
jgi:hypothetical protein